MQYYTAFLRNTYSISNTIKQAFISAINNREFPLDYLKICKKIKYIIILLEDKRSKIPEKSKISQHIKVAKNNIKGRDFI